MTEVRFDSENIDIESRALSSAKSVSGMKHLVIALGLAKDEEGAQRALVIVLILCIVGLGAMFFTRGKDAPPKNPYVEGQNVLLPPQGNAR
ncbi:MAG: hypothetical protein V4480_04685 [Patescibacteria group bacterium]